MRKKMVSLLTATVLLASGPLAVCAEDFESVPQDIFTDSAETEESIISDTEIDFSDEEALSAGEKSVEYPYKPTINLELNKYYYVKDMEVHDNTLNNGDMYYLFKTLVPKNGRIRILLEDCDSKAFNNYFSIENLEGMRKWWETGLESYDSGWITVKAGELQGYLTNGEYCNDVNREARFMIQYQQAGEYNGECEDNDTYDTANEISSGIVYECDSSKSEDVDVYKFHMQEAGLADISLLNKQSGIDCSGILYEEDENENVYELVKIKNKAHVRLKAGNYFIKTSGTMQYTLCAELNAESPDAFEQENNNVKSLANEKKPNIWYTGNLNDASDIDYFKFDILSKGDITIEFKVPRELQENAIKISLYDEELELLDSAENTSNPYLITEKEQYPAGTYYVRVERGSGRETFVGDYSFRLNKNEQIWVEEIRLSDAEMETGEKLKLVPDILPENASDKKLDWYSDNEEIAVVNQSGLVTAINPGKTVIYAIASDRGEAWGIAHITVKGKKNVSKLTYSAVKSAEHTGSAIKPSVKIKDGSRTLTQNKDYKISYKNNKNIGTASIVITGKGEYTGSKTIKFSITPKRPVMSSVSQAGTGKLKVVWKKQSGVHGYAVYRSTSANGTYSKVKTIKGSGTTSYTNSGLASGKKYYYKVRSYKTVNGKNYYSGYSKEKYATTKSAPVKFKKKAYSAYTNGGFYMNIDRVNGRKMTVSISMPTMRVNKLQASIAADGITATAYFKCPDGYTHKLTFISSGKNVKVTEYAPYCYDKMINPYEHGDTVSFTFYDDVFNPR